MNVSRDDAAGERRNVGIRVLIFTINKKIDILIFISMIIIAVLFILYLFIRKTIFTF